MKKLLIGLLALTSLHVFAQDSEFSFHCRKDHAEYQACKSSCREDARYCRKDARGTQAKDQCRYEKEDCLDSCENSYPEWRQVDGPCFW